MPHNLPPNCFMNDIDSSLSTCPRCDGSGISESNPDLECSTCGGEGSVIASSIHPADRNPMGMGEDDLSYD